MKKLYWSLLLILFAVPAHAQVTCVGGGCGGSFDGTVDNQLNIVKTASTDTVSVQTTADGIVLLKDLSGGNFARIAFGCTTVACVGLAVRNDLQALRIVTADNGNYANLIAGKFMTRGESQLSQANDGVMTVLNSPGNVSHFLGGWTPVASATALPTPVGSSYHVTGTTTITSITATGFTRGVQITLIFDGVLTVTDGSNLKLAGDFVTTADDTLTLVYDGTNWYEIARAVN